MNWYYAKGGKTFGPVTDEQFPALVENGLITNDTHLWCQGMTQWQKYAELIGATAPAALVAAPAADSVARPMAEPAATAVGLRIKREAVAPPVEERQVTCSQCGAVVSAHQLMTVGAAQLCPKCQGGYQRLAQAGWSGGAVQYASPFVRFGVFLADYILCWIGTTVVLLGGMFITRAVAGDNRTAALALMLVTFLIAFIWVFKYFVSSIANEGSTLIMRAAGIKVVSTAGSLISGWRALGRFLVIGLINSFTFGLGHLVALFDQQKRSLHDMICGTIVVKR